MNEFTLLRVCKEMDKYNVTSAEMTDLAKDVAGRTLSFPEGTDFKSSRHFVRKMASFMSIDESLFAKAYPKGDHNYFSKTLEEINTEEEIPEEEILEKSVYVDFSDVEDGQLLNLSKAAPSAGMTTKGSITGAIDEYERLFTAGFASDGEILTLSRFYPLNKEYAQLAGAILEDREPMIVGGPASVEVVDREGHLITMEAMDKAFKKFMGNIRTRNAMVLHSDVQVGWALPAYINKAGQIFKSGVNGKHLFFITEMRNDTKIAERVREQVKEGRIRSYSIAGSALNTDQTLTRGKDGRDTIVTKVTELELAEVTVCEKGVNQGAHFNLLKAHGSETSKTCIDGSCLITLEKEQAGPGSGVPNGADTGGNYNPFYGGFDPDKDLPKAGDLVETYSMDNTTQGSSSPGLESYEEYNEDKTEEIIDYNSNLREVIKMFKVQGSSEEKKLVRENQAESSLEKLKRHTDGPPKSDSFATDKGTLAEIFDTPEEILAETKKIREKYGWPKMTDALNELQDMANNPPARGTWQRGTTVTTAGEDEQTLDITKSKDCGCS
jgi:hypothetical protein